MPVIPSRLPRACVNWEGTGKTSAKSDTAVWILRKSVGSWIMPVIPSRLSNAIRMSWGTGRTVDSSSTARLTSAKSLMSPVAFAISSISANAWLRFPDGIIIVNSA